MKLNRLTKMHITEIEKAEREQLRAHANKLAAQLAECAGYLASVRTDRKIRDQFGDVFAGQTLEWAEGAKEIAERTNVMLEEHDAIEDANHSAAPSNTAVSQPGQPLPPT